MSWKPGESITLCELETIFRAREPHLRQVISGRIPPALRAILSADDVLQEAWLDLCRERAGFRFRGEQALHNWLDEVVQHTLYDMFRHARRQKRAPERRIQSQATSFMSRFLAIPAAGRSPSSEFAARERSLQVRDALELLPEEEKAALHIACEAQQSKRTVAHTLDRSEPSFRALWSRGLHRLRRLLFRLQEDRRR